MKSALLFVGVLMLSAAQMPAALGTEKKTCKVNIGGLGSIVGRGATAEGAFEDAAIQCFEKLESRHRARANSNFDEETGVAIIDVCGNITCG